MSKFSAGIIPIRDPDGDRRYLLLRAYNYWDFPKGAVNVGELPLDAALRELREETGLTTARFRWGKQYVETPPYSHGKIARYYAAEVGDAGVRLLPEPISHRVEHHEFRWLSYGDAARLLVPRVARILSWAEQLVSRHDSSSLMR